MGREGGREEGREERERRWLLDSRRQRGVGFAPPGRGGRAGFTPLHSSARLRGATTINPARPGTRNQRTRTGERGCLFLISFSVSFLGRRTHKSDRPMGGGEEEGQPLAIPTAAAHVPLGQASTDTGGRRTEGQGQIKQQSQRIIFTNGES
ncbi:unnamed protein product [Arctogadus glacialis]